MTGEMLNSILELIATFGFGAFVAALAFLWARRSLTQNEDIILSKDDPKSKLKSSKSTIKVKIAKKETSSLKPKSISKPKSIPVEDALAVNNTKNRSTIKDVTESITSSVGERNRTDSTAEWTKVKKPTKKPKKDSKIELDNSSNEDNKVPVKETSTKESFTPTVITEKETKSTQKESQSTKKVKIEPVKESTIDKVSVKPVENATKSSKNKKLTPEQTEVIVPIVAQKHQETKIKPSTIETKLSTSNDAKSKVVPNETEDLQAKINQLTNELEKLKNSNKEDSKANNLAKNELEQLKLKLKTSQTNEEKLMDDLKKKGQAVTDLKNQFLIIQSELTKNIVSNQSVSREKTSLESRLRSLEEQSLLLNEKHQRFEQMQIENQSLINNLRATEEELKKVKHEYSDKLKSRDMELTTQIVGLQSDKQRLQDQLVRVQTDLIDNNNKMQSFQQDLLTAKNAHADQLTENLQLKKLSSEQLTDFEKKTKQFEHQITGLKTQIDEMNANNVALSEQKHALQLQLNEAQSSKISVNSSELDQLKEQIQILTKEVEQSKKQLLKSEMEINEYKSSFEKSTSQLRELTSERDNLMALVDQYKTGLESTELILSKLQTSVNEEESKWRESLLKSEAEAEKSKKELEIVFNDLMRIRDSRAGKNELNFAYHCVDKSLSSLIDEMEARMIHFEKCFDTVVQERDNALAQMSSQINGVSNKHENGTANADDEQQLLQEKIAELEKLNADLNIQLEMNKTLENQCNKYRSLIDIGKDALGEEQALVRELQEKLNSLQPACTNVEIPLNSNSF